MLSPKYKLLVADIDGTLTPSVPGSYPSDRVTKTIQKAVVNGLIFSIASGRPFIMVKYLADYLGHIGPCIVDNGAAIIDSKDSTVLWEALLPYRQAQKIIKILQPFKNFRMSGDMGVIDKPKVIEKTMKIRKISVHDIAIDTAENLIETVNKMFNDVTCIKAAAYASDKLIDVYFSDIKATKQQAVFQLAEILNINHDEIIGVGDGYNDFPLLMASGLKVAMGNAVDELKAIADYIAPSVDDDGLTDVMEKFCCSL